MANRNFVTSELELHFLGQGHRSHFDIFGLRPSWAAIAPNICNLSPITYFVTNTRASNLPLSENATYCVSLKIGH